VVLRRLSTRLLNRYRGQVDQFSKMHDFARAYGSLCWNLSKVIPRKDLPKYVLVPSVVPRPCMLSTHDLAALLCQDLHHVHPRACQREIVARDTS